ncbi:unnamed protein product, partial [Rotaria sp. Silwood2]
VIANRQLATQEEIQHFAPEFLSNMRKDLLKYDPDYVFNNGSIWYST